MSHQHGSIAAYPKQKRNRLALTAFVGYSTLMFTLGIGTGVIFSPHTWVGLGIILSAGAFEFFLLRWIDRNTNTFHNHNAGTRGEARVARLLGRLSHKYHVFHGINLGSGDIDHLVIGPTGVFCIDTKNWQGDITHDGNGELLLNGNPLDKPVCRTAIQRVMKLREKMGYAEKGGPYFQAVVVFVDPDQPEIPAQLGRVDCMPSHKLLEYLKRFSDRKRIEDSDIAQLAAFADRLIPTSVSRAAQPPI